MALTATSSVPELYPFYTPGAKRTIVYLAGVGPPARVLLGGVGEDGRIDPSSFAGLFPHDNHLFVAYAPRHDEEALFEILAPRLAGDCEFVCHSMGAKAFYGFEQWCADRWHKRAFRITGVTFINPATTPQGLQPAQLRVVKLCHAAARHPWVCRSGLIQKLWTGRHGNGLWRRIWPESPSDRAQATRDGRLGSYELYRRSQRLCRVTTIVTTSATLANPAFGGPTVCPAYTVRLITLTSDTILRPRVNEDVIARHYEGHVVVRHIDGPPDEVGGHDSILVNPRPYRAAYEAMH